MKRSFEYGGYVIANSEGVFVASSLDEPCELRSQYLLRIIRAIDTIWDALEQKIAPSWLLSWIEDPALSIDLDAAADAVALPEQCANSHLDPIKALRFPGKPIKLIGRATVGAFTVPEIRGAPTPVGLALG